MNERLDKLAACARRLMRRSAIVGVYLVVLMAALYVPLLFSYFKTQRTLNVYAFTETFSPEAIELFEERTGIKINITYAELDEEIGAKFAINGGIGYDVVNVSDFMVRHLSKQGYLQKLDYSCLPNAARLNPRLLGRVFDPKNAYSLPHKWFMYGLVYDKNVFKVSPDQMSLAFVFNDPEQLYKKGLVSRPYRVCMIDSPMDAYFLSMLSLFNRFDQFTPQEFDAITRQLLQQKQWVECYTLYTVEYFLLSGIIPIALTSSNFVRKIWDMSDQYEFAIPREGGILVIENLVIPKTSRKGDLAHEFINFMLSDEVATLNSQEYGWTSANKSAQETLDAQYKRKSHLFPDEHVFKRLHIPLFTSYARRCADDAWLRVGFA